MKKKTIALLLGTVIGISALSGCWGRETSSSNLKPPGNSSIPSTSTNLPAKTPAPGASAAPAPVTPTPFGTFGEEQTLSNGETGRLLESSFVDGPGFFIYVTLNYDVFIEDAATYIRSKDKPDEAYIEIKFIKNGKADRIAPSALDKYDTIAELTDHDTSDIGVIPYRFVEGKGRDASWKAYIMDGPAGALQLVVREGAGQAAALDAMVRTFNPK